MYLCIILIIAIVISVIFTLLIAGQFTKEHMDDKGKTAEVWRKELRESLFWSKLFMVALIVCASVLFVVTKIVLADDMKASEWPSTKYEATNVQPDKKPDSDRTIVTFLAENGEEAQMSLWPYELESVNASPTKFIIETFPAKKGSFFLFPTVEQTRYRLE